MPARFLPRIAHFLPDDGGDASELVFLAVENQKLVEIDHAVAHCFVLQGLVARNFTVRFGLHGRQRGKQGFEPVFPAGPVFHNHVFPFRVQVNNAEVVVADGGQKVVVVCAHAVEHGLGFGIERLACHDGLDWFYEKRGR